MEETTTKKSVRRPKKKNQELQNLKTSETCNESTDTKYTEYNARSKTMPSRISRRRKATPVLHCDVAKKRRTMPSLVELEQMFENYSSEELGSSAITEEQVNLLHSTKNTDIATPFLKEKLDDNQTVSTNIPVVGQSSLPLQKDNNLNETPFTTNNISGCVSDLTNFDQTLSNSKLTYNDIDLTEEGSDDSQSSIKTIIYDYSDLQSIPNVFSPLPSTSTDTETMMKNEKLFNDSLLVESQCDNDNKAIIIGNSNITNSFGDQDVEIIEAPIETIVIEDVLPNEKNQIVNNSIIDIDEYIASSQDSVQFVPNTVESSDIINLTGNSDQSVIIDNTEHRMLESLIHILTSQTQSHQSSVHDENIRRTNSRTTQRNRTINKSTHVRTERPPTAKPHISNQISYGEASHSKKDSNIIRNQEVEVSSIEVSEKENLFSKTSKCQSNLGMCPICMDHLNKDIVSTMCGHLFCMKCLTTAIQKSGRKCPTCRKNIKKNGYHQIFI